MTTGTINSISAVPRGGDAYIPPIDTGSITISPDLEPTYLGVATILEERM